MPYCNEADIYLFGVPRGALAVSGRVAGAVSTTSDTVELDGHGFVAGDEVQFRAEEGGSLSSPLAEGTTYYVLAVDDWRFQVAATSGGSAIDLTTAGDGVIVLAAPPVDGAISWAERVIDDMLPAHVIPIADPVPEIVRATCAELAGAKLLALSGGQSESLSAVLDAAQKRIERWARNAPIRGTNAPETAQQSQTTAASTRTESDWRRYGGIA